MLSGCEGPWKYKVLNEEEKKEVDLNPDKYKVDPSTQEVSRLDGFQARPGLNGRVQLRDANMFDISPLFWSATANNIANLTKDGYSCAKPFHFIPPYIVAASVINGNVNYARFRRVSDKIKEYFDYHPEVHKDEQIRPGKMYIVKIIKDGKDFMARAIVVGAGRLADHITCITLDADLVLEVPYASFFMIPEQFQLDNLPCSLFFTEVSSIAHTLQGSHASIDALLAEFAKRNDFMAVIRELNKEALVSAEFFEIGRDPVYSLYMYHSRSINGAMAQQATQKESIAFLAAMSRRSSPCYQNINFKEKNLFNLFSSTSSEGTSSIVHSQNAGKTFPSSARKSRNMKNKDPNYPDTSIPIPYSNLTHPFKDGERQSSKNLQNKATTSCEPLSVEELRGDIKKLTERSAKVFSSLQNPTFAKQIYHTFIKIIVESLIDAEANRNLSITFDGNMHFSKEE